jgi:hypothetical protein
MPTGSSVAGLGQLLGLSMLLLAFLADQAGATRPSSNRYRLANLAGAWVLLTCAGLIGHWWLAAAAAAWAAVTGHALRRASRQ